MIFKKPNVDFTTSLYYYYYFILLLKFFIRILRLKIDIIDTTIDNQ